MPQPRVGAGIINSKGVPGTLGCTAYTLHTGQAVLLSTWHVLFGNDADEERVVWLINEADDGLGLSGIGNTLYGKIGTVQFAGGNYYLDCAIASYTETPTVLASQTRTKSPTFINGHGIAQLGDVVTKIGAATGVTRGIVADVNYSDSASPRDKGQLTPGQLLLRPLEEDKLFSADGDSGAVVVDAANKVVGLLWGTNVRGEGVACPIAPVLYAMNITLDPRA
ncbi:MAG TPA: hypothetical protein VFH15_03770 [Pyrinomonadaceae bacterium]|nr:hypothetical protein [Pyrinomonadaceae bacterium]